MHPLECSIKEQFERFFADLNTIALGVCNGCQMLSQLKSIIPGADLVFTVRQQIRTI